MPLDGGLVSDNGRSVVLQHVMSKLTGKVLPRRAVGLEDIELTLYSMLESTVNWRRGESCILPGPRGSGKTILVESCLSRLAKEFPDQFLLVRLNGLAHTDDKMAIREISRQIDVLMDKLQPNTEKLERPAISATLLSLLQMLENADKEESEDALVLDYNRESGQGGINGLRLPDAEKKVSVVFVIDDIDAFIGPSNKQTLIYNLLDVVQESTIGIAVVGTTTQMNLTESFEKRVRSRFSRRFYPVPRPPDLAAFANVCRTLLEVDDPILKEQFPEETIQWSNEVSRMLVRGSQLDEIVTAVYYTTKNVVDFRVRAAPIILKIYRSSSIDAITGNYEGNAGTESFLERIDIASSLESMIRELPELDWALLIAAARVVIKYEMENVNLTLTLEEYRELVISLKHQRSGGVNISGYRQWSPQAARLAWERLQAMDLVVPTNTDDLAVPADLRMVRPAATLPEMRGLVPDEHVLHAWTKI